MITAEQLKFNYKQGEDTLSFPDINLDGNNNLLILGKSGIGKTTLLHLLAGLLKPQHGSIHINHTAIHKLSSSKLDEFRGEHIGIVFQKNHAVQSLTVYENLKARLYFSKRPIDVTKIDALLNELDLLELKHSKPNHLSQGQLQRLGIAMSVIHEPKLILADEPTSSLDDENCAIVVDLLKKQAEKHSANLIVITHDQRVKSYFKHSMTL